ncbi:UNVERIFIED_CONTAM: putative indole-3-acetic acid-amido synthetase GH3.11 [Sesamum radiatum]|uniref:Indole-3-acetic acid-amido synthetase GH3.11 n=1 Tax=Sesamum radiatum TaxID=300843 RepID=A0AAW2W3N2_SESRA
MTYKYCSHYTRSSSTHATAQRLSVYALRHLLGDQQTNPPQEPPVSAEDVEECCIAVEEGLDYVYRRCRTNDKTVGPLEIRVVKAGTFEKLMDLFIAQGGASINQYKTPRCVKSKAALKLLNANVSSCYFSPRDPAWNA